MPCGNVSTMTKESQRKKTRPQYISKATKRKQRKKNQYTQINKQNTATTTTNQQNNKRLENNKTKRINCRANGKTKSKSKNKKHDSKRLKKVLPLNKLAATQRVFRNQQNNLGFQMFQKIQEKSQLTKQDCMVTVPCSRER